MNAQQMWKAFARKNRIKAPYTAWAYGSAADELAKLTFDGVKTATASAYPLYAVDEEPLPQVGEYSVILDSQDEAVCIIQCTKVSVVPFRIKRVRGIEALHTGGRSTKKSLRSGLKRLD